MLHKLMIDQSKNMNCLVTFCSHTYILKYHAETCLTLYPAYCSVVQIFAVRVITNATSFWESHKEKYIFF